MADMQELIARLEAAEVGSRELDAVVWAATNGYELVRFDGAGWLYKMHAEDIQRHERTGFIPGFSQSIDAALALADRIIPGWWIELRRYSDGWYVKVAPHSSKEADALQGFQKPAAIALCIAILKAKAQGDER
ncbi:hypothetical protein HNP32_003470 [Brevundimonas bullata]|uniref:Phage ABA sandwich domain-containing protein n=1 Tax=Brevundimonas bullata TaxID=13160 RepID=A0A7W7ITJ8_9CAUL|nr:hypothetical protein [Brevundimonas bullata]MBB4799710.1 hypothetical protein [Brevundimonas bullata]MBB6384668.1 hypothetical protein [Brevundimonas bullata]